MAAFVVERCVFANEATPLVLGLAAIVGLLPDIDGLAAMVAKRHKPSQQKMCHHQWWSHTPLFYVGLTALVTLLTSLHYGVLFGVLMFVHLLLDSWSTDDGIMWLWPLSRRQYALFPTNLHADGAFGVRFYRRHVRCGRVIIPEVLLVVSGVLLAFRVLSVA